MNPKLLILGGVGVVVAFLLLRNKQAPVTTTNTTQGDLAPSTNALGGSYQYLDGSGQEHIIATDPYGNLVGYSNVPPGTASPQTGQLASYVGSMSGQQLVSPWGSSTPYYAMAPYG